MKRILDIKRTTLAGLLALTLGVVTTPPAAAAPLSLSDVPLFIDLGVTPNVQLTLDDSSSMVNCRVTSKGVDDDWLLTSSTTWLRGMGSPDINALAYNPNVEYKVPVDANGVSLPVPSFTSAWPDAYFPASPVDLSSSWRPCKSTSKSGSTTWIGNAGPAWYARFKGSDPKSQTQIQDDSNYTVIVVGSAADTGGFGATAAQKKQNFANWFSYYRWRYQMIKTVTALVFGHSDLNNRIRLSSSLMWGGENRYCTTAGWPGACGDQIYTQEKPGPISLTRQFTGTARANWLSWLFSTRTSGGTPLLISTERAGRYFMDQYPVYDTSQPNYVRWENMNPVNSPWSFDPGVTRDPVHSCRQAFYILMTDGGYDTDIANKGILGNIDNQSWTYPEKLPSGTTTYTPFAPYKDSNGSSSYGFLADNAFYFWVNDLQPTIPNDVPAYMMDPTPHPVTGKAEDNPKNDPATWQHMVSFTVGFAVDGTAAFPADYDALLNGSKSWGTDKIDDLWHTAINGRGQYFNGGSPTEMVDAFSTALTSVLARTSSGGGVAQTSGELTAGTQFFQGRFNSGNWTGQVLAFDVDPVTGFVLSPEAWDGAAKLTTQVAGSGWNTGRTVLTWSGTQGIPFRWSSLSSAMQTELNKNGQGSPDAVGFEQGSQRLEYLRGSEADEGSNGNQYRARASKLGDIITSAPTFVGDPAFNYPDNLEASGEKYSTFKANKTGRAPMVYVGANDGMLHGFEATKPAVASTGTEKLAYVPKAVFPRLTRLTASNYAHRFFVDGSPTAGDAFWGGIWHTVLVGGLNKGGQGIYALDVTDPSGFNESSASSLVLWEFTDANDKDLGYTFSRPSVARVQTGWAAIFGNGYNNTEADSNVSTSGNAALYILDIQNGSVIRKFDTGVGTAQDPTGSGRPNGLATVSPVDVDGDRVMDLVYAGDLFGNLWKFDLRNSNPVLWTKTKLFTATDEAGPKAQSITVRPEVGLHPQSGKPGYMIYFGTGKYLEPSDNVTINTQVQTFWGIWDPDTGSVPPYARSKMLKQQITEEVAVNVNGTLADMRITTDNTINWANNPLSPAGTEHIGWYMDLVNTGVTPLNNKGERQVTSALLRNGRIIFTTLIPSGSSCVFGGDGWLMELDAADGSRLGDPPFDVDGDGVFDLVTDKNGNAVPPSGIKSRVGAPSEPSVLDRGDGTEVKTISGSDGGKLQQEIESSPPPPAGTPGRESWQQLR